MSIHHRARRHKDGSGDRAHRPESTGRRYLAHEVFGIADSDRLGPIVPCYLPPAEPDPLAILAERVRLLERQLARLRRAQRRQGQSVDELAERVIELEDRS